MDQDEDDFVFYGTPIEREEETSTRKRKAAADAGQLRTLPPWKQEVTDEEGRKRFHGAFTGGFSAGYYNTVGSKEGWTPQTFTSSRKSRAEVKQQSIYSFLDDDEKAEMEGHALKTSLQFDTFGFTAAELARQQAEKEQQKRPSAIPGPVPDEIVLPASNSIGMKLLLKMGWRHGHSIRDTRAESLYDARREARKAFIAFSGNGKGSELAEVKSFRPDSEDFTERLNDGVYASQSTPVYVLYPKQDLHGLGYDPYKNAPEFRDRKSLQGSGSKDRGKISTASMRENLFVSNSGKFAPGFGIGALEELDVEDEDIYASGFEFQEAYVEEVEPSTKIRDNKHKLEHTEHGVLSGFKGASSSDYNLERFPPPVIPPDFQPLHKFPAPLDTAISFAESPPPEVPPPDDGNLRLLIEGFATLVARCGKVFEDLSKEKHKSNPLFSFLNGGNGKNYYTRKLWEEQQKRVDQQKQQGDMKSVSFVEKMTSESRGRILGERPLERSSNDSSSSVGLTEVIHLETNLSDTFTTPASLIGLSESTKPFKSDPPKQERFEQFLKDKYQGGLRSTYCGGNSDMSETDRARERLDFEAAAEAIEKGEWKTNNNLPSIQKFMELPGTGERQFISSTGAEKHQISQDDEKSLNKFYPKREEFQWRPSPILCKRFDIIDPFMGKPPHLPRARSRMDTLIFTTDSVKKVKAEENDAAKKVSQPVFQSEFQETGEQLTTKEPDIEPTTTNLQRPVDLYKAIFSDDSDDEGENGFNHVDDPEKKTEGATTTLNRLIAGDFLESLGKELGLEVPPETSCPSNKTKNSSSIKGTGGREDLKISSRNDISTSTLETFNILPEDKEARPSSSKSRCQEITTKSASGKTCEVVDKEVIPFERDGTNHAYSQSGNLSISFCSGAAGSGFSGQKEVKVEEEKVEYQAKKHRTHSRHCRSKSSTSDTDSSSDDGYYDRSRSRGRTSSHGKNRKHSKHHKHKSKKSPTRYSSRDSDKDLTDDKRKDRKSRDLGRHSVSSKLDGHKKHR